MRKNITLRARKKCGGTALVVIEKCCNSRHAIAMQDFCCLNIELVATVVCIY